MRHLVPQLKRWNLVLRHEKQTLPLDICLDTWLSKSKYSSSAFVRTLRIWHNSSNVSLRHSLFVFLADFLKSKQKFFYLIFKCVYLEIVNTFRVSTQLSSLNSRLSGNSFNLYNFRFDDWLCWVRRPLSVDVNELDARLKSANVNVCRRLASRDGLLYESWLLAWWWWWWKSSLNTSSVTRAFQSSTGSRHGVSGDRSDSGALMRFLFVIDVPSVDDNEPDVRLNNTLFKLPSMSGRK